MHVKIINNRKYKIEVEMTISLAAFRAMNTTTGTTENNEFYVFESLSFLLIKFFRLVFVFNHHQLA